MTAGRVRPGPWVVAVVVAVVAAAIDAWRHQGKLCGPVDDETLLLPIALRHAGLASFDGDRWLATTAQVFSVPYSWVVGTFLRWIDDPVVALRWLALPFHVVFLAGTWRVVERFADRESAMGAVAVALVAPSPLAGALLTEGGGLPRDLVFALLPWFVLGAESFRERRVASLALFFALGVAANLHPLTALHAVIWLLLIEFLRAPSANAVGAGGLRGLAFAVGASPYVFQYVTRPVTAGAVEEAVYAWRLGAMSGETIGVWTLRMELLLWLAAAVVVVAVAARRSGTSLPRWLVAGAATAFILTALGPTIGRFVPPLRAFQFARFERMAAWSGVLCFVAAATVAARGRQFGAVVAGAALLVAGAYGPEFLGGVPPRGPIARVGRKLDRDAGISYESPAPPGLAVRKDVADPTSPAFRDAFLAVCRHIRETAPPDALFLVPPEHWGPFRVYARRGTAVTRKEGGAAMSFLGAAGMEWFRDYAEAVAVYRDGDAGAWDALARRHGAAFAVVDASTGSPPAWPVAFEAPPFRVLAVPAK